MKKKLTEEEQKDKEFDDEFEKYANQPLSSEEFHALMKKWENFMNNEILKNKYKHTKHTYFEKSYLKGIKELSKKHRKDVIEKLDKIVSELETFDITTQYNNHVLSDGETYELHVPCKGDILLTYKYVSGDLFIDLKLLNLVEHKNLGKKLNSSLEEDVKEIKVANNEDIEKDAEECPLPLEVIPNEMGINLSNVEKVTWEEQEDGQLKKVEIDFNPGDDLEEDIEKHDTLNPKLFDGEDLKPEIKDKIEQIAYQFVRELNEDGIRFTLKDIVLLGSNVSYNYTKDSDLDIHLIADSSGLECPDDLYPLLYSAYRSMFNKNYDIRIKGIPSEIYVEMDEPLARSNGIYSLNTGWLKKPEQRDIPDLDTESFDKLFTEWEDKYFDLINGEPTAESIEDFIEDIYDLRKSSIASDGEYGLGNLVFKEFRNIGYLDNLKEIRRQDISNELSLEHLDEEMSDDELFDKVMNMLKNNMVDDEQLFRISDESVYTLDEIKQDIIDNPARVVRALIEEEVFTKEMFESLDEGIFDKIHDKKFGTHTLSKKESGGTIVVGLEVGSDKFSKEEQEEFTKDNLEHYKEKIQKVLRDNNIDGATISAIHDGEWQGNWEHSVDVSLLYIKEKDLVKVAKELRTSFKQDVVLVRLNKNNKIYSIDN